MVASFDLISEPWLPVLAGTQTRLVGLRELFTQAHTFEDLAVPVPPAASGLWRILYAITARVTGLDEVAGWAQRQDDWMRRGRLDPDRVNAYFDQHREAFDLFHPVRPWLQDPRLAAQCPTSSGVNKLVFGRPAGNTQVWFGHHTDADPMPVAAGEAAWHLVAQLYYGASGQCTPREVNGARFGNAYAGPLRTSMSYHPVGRTLFESLVVGVPRAHTAPDEADRCPWEREDHPDPLGAPQPVTWPGGLLTGGLHHAVLLVPSPDGQTATDAYVTWGRRQPTGLLPDPYVILKLSRQGDWYRLRADGARALWRDVYALLPADATADHRRPRIIDSARLHDHGGQLRVRAYGFDQDGQAKDRQWFTAVTPPVLCWLSEHDEDAAFGAEDLHAAAEKVGALLTSILRAAWREATQPVDDDKPAKGRTAKDGPWVRAAVEHYWSRAEPLFWQHMRERQWQLAAKAYQGLGHEAIDHATDGLAHRPRVARAVRGAHRRLAAALREGEAL